MTTEGAIPEKELQYLVCMFLQAHHDKYGDYLVLRSNISRIEQASKGSDYAIRVFLERGLDGKPISLQYVTNSEFVKECDYNYDKLSSWRQNHHSKYFPLWTSLAAAAKVVNYFEIDPTWGWPWYLSGDKKLQSYGLAKHGMGPLKNDRSLFGPNMS